MSTDAKITLYTNRGLWAHRVHIALEELGLPYEEVRVDTSVPRASEYLAINPRGLVPSLVYNGEIIVESAIIVQFLVDAYPSHLLPPSTSVEGALQRARISFFVDAFLNKFQSQVNRFYTATASQDAAIVDAAVAALVKEVEPLLTNAKPFFGGSESLTFAEVLLGSHTARLLALLRGDVYPLSGKFIVKLEAQVPNFWQWANAVAVHPSVTKPFEKEAFVERIRKRLGAARAAAEAAASA
ncbi:thioredoxin-like protein [Chytriomyces sp. MP71]|nr:thioredoxin-like protein [Chytriomyces sp. MP71]